MIPCWAIQSASFSSQLSLHASNAPVQKSATQAWGVVSTEGTPWVSKKPFLAKMGWSFWQPQCFSHAVMPVQSSLKSKVPPTWLHAASSPGNCS